MTTYYKATREDGTDFHTGLVDYGAALTSGELVTHPSGDVRSVTGDAATYLSVSTSTSDCTGFRWPCRLFAVEPVDPWTPHATDLPNKRACLSLRVVEELPAWQVFGPNGERVVAVIDRASRLTPGEVERLDAARDAAGAAAWAAPWAAARDAAWAAARDAAWDAAWAAAWAAARDAAWDAAWAAARDAAWDAAWAAPWAAARDAAWAAARAAARAAAGAAAWAAARASIAETVRDLITPEQYELLAGPWNTVIADGE